MYALLLYNCYKLFLGFFIPGFPKLQRFQEHHDKILTRFLPKLKKHLDKYEIHTSLYTLKWFFQCFLDRVFIIFFIYLATFLFMNLNISLFTHLF